MTRCDIPIMNLVGKKITIEQKSLPESESKILSFLACKVQDLDIGTVFSSPESTSLKEDIELC